MYSKCFEWRFSLSLSLSTCCASSPYFTQLHLSPIRLAPHETQNTFISCFARRVIQTRASREWFALFESYEFHSNKACTPNGRPEPFMYSSVIFSNASPNNTLGFLSFGGARRSPFDAVFVWALCGNLTQLQRLPFTDAKEVTKRLYVCTTILRIIA